MTAVDVDALAKLREAATPGPWAATPNFVGGFSVRDADTEPLVGPSGFQPADAALIVAAVNALPDLLAEVRRGRALREAVEGLVEAGHGLGINPSITEKAALARALANARATLAALDPP